MRIASGFATAGLTSAILLAGAPAALAVCDPYAETCVETEIQDKTPANPQPAAPPARANTSVETLPFTGGEVTLLSVIGAAALATGGALVVAGRRRAQST